ncbi:hypothetical protein COY52_11685 [Candidatus Desantisbacteria bacterium CG_4_10_14_0_8_um_filter_48_22]|uniref:Ig-like domain-containing protein n=1 Tax=Candidatus Desantisbacteria bacterium CG_4_10_14_0_8_um_filter_48_22 TaxID=1974543 RepID=A0A2M7S5E2_9BACT|nr:MAG: hypothetical protein AUJ67_00705 [Candidatus Desantisbacteria bacterium CG1_02_49_89]PIV55288.1 MAG: hypothetical protein COS16_07740 [Candidatus Desantisbacteria bacterium CG02_land_8_20_14_3_00_49_13]PIZ14659.1 MAG: hypothetical protein COY52_11685 [Candidatus Desantisbacteria bacterium CG_4_10_14_0_8_um_filter_48_22]PJB28465.1 MAG: hypothetical protein CO111_01590 [Candidatus Desantisbacteria bacterium CG_4_9_14_3_um_filter_50_7]
MNKMFLMSVMFLMVFSVAAGAQQAQTISSGGKVCLPEECPAGSIPVLTVKLIWKDLEASAGGTGREIIEEVVFKGMEGDREIKFYNARITPSFPRGRVSIDAKCEIKRGESVARTYETDRDNKNNPAPVSYEGAAKGGFSDLKIYLK